MPEVQPKSEKYLPTFEAHIDAFMQGLHGQLLFDPHYARVAWCRLDSAWQRPESATTSGGPLFHVRIQHTHHAARAPARLARTLRGGCPVQLRAEYLNKVVFSEELTLHALVFTGCAPLKAGASLPKGCKLRSNRVILRDFSQQVRTDYRIPRSIAAAHLNLLPDEEDWEQNDEKLRKFLLPFAHVQAAYRELCDEVIACFDLESAPVERRMKY